MQAVDQIRAKNYKTALTSINKAKLWPENLGAGKPYDEDIDLRLEHYMEALVHEKTREKEQAKKKYEAIIAASTTSGRRNQITNLITALAYRKTSRNEEGEKLLAAWREEQPDNKIAKWAYAVYNGESAGDAPEGNEILRIMKEIVNL